MFSRNDCGSCALRAQCTKSKTARAIRVTERTQVLWRLRRKQKTKRFRRRYRKRVVVEHRLGRMVQLGIRQAKYYGSKKTAFQVALTATVANLCLVAATLLPASAAAISFSFVAWTAALALLLSCQPTLTLERRPFRPGLSLA